MTIVYLIRHSEPLKNIKKVFIDESLQLENEKTPLSIEGEEAAKNWAKDEEFQNVASVWSSNYVRAIATAKYFAKENSLSINIDGRLNERALGVKEYKDLPIDFEKRQLNEPDYKIEEGESQIETQTRMLEVLQEIIEQNQNKKIVIVTHATAITFLLKKWCTIIYGEEFTFKNPFFNGKWHYLETFKLTFSDNLSLLNIEHIN